MVFLLHVTATDLISDMHNGNHTGHSEYVDISSSVELLLGVLADAPNVKPSTVSIESGVFMRVPLRRGVSTIIAQHGFISYKSPCPLMAYKSLRSGRKRVMLTVALRLKGRN